MLLLIRKPVRRTLQLQLRCELLKIGQPNCGRSCSELTNVLSRSLTSSFEYGGPAIQYVAEKYGGGSSHGKRLVSNRTRIFACAGVHVSYIVWAITQPASFLLEVAVLD